VLTGVQHDERSARGEVLGECVGRGTLRRDLDSHRSRRLLGDQRKIHQAAEIDEPCPAGKQISGRLGGGDRKARLAGTVRPAQRDNPLAPEELDHIPELLLASEEARELDRELARRRLVGRRREEAAVEGPRDCVRLGFKPSAELVAQALELRERVLTATRACIAAHQEPVGRLVQRLVVQHPLGAGHGIADPPLALAAFRKLQAQGRELLAQ
jgi:hypothetical protein